MLKISPVTSKYTGQGAEEGDEIVLFVLTEKRIEEKKNHCYLFKLMPLQELTQNGWFTKICLRKDWV